MVPSLQKFDPVLEYAVDQPVFVVEPSRPDVASEVLDALRLSHALERIAHDGFDQTEQAECQLAIVLHEVSEICEEQRMKCCDPSGSAPLDQARTPGAVPLPTRV
jgi:hypothetical protein